MSEDGQRNAEGVIDAVRDLFGHAVFNRAQHLSTEDMLAKPMRLDLSKLPDGVRLVVAQTLLKRVFGALQMRGPIPVRPASDQERFRLFVVVDEARIITVGGDRTLDEIFTQARKFGLGMILASQRADHFSEDVRANAATWLVLHPQAMEEAKRNAPNVGVAPEDLLALRGRGDGYFRAGAEPARRIQVKPVA